MNLLYGEIVDVFLENEMRSARVRVGCALKDVSLALVGEAEPGDTVLVCDGVALSKMIPRAEESYVSGNPRQSA